MIVVDTSALVAILFSEPQADLLMQALSDSPVGARYLSAATYVEFGTVVAGRLKGDPLEAIPVVDEFLADLGLSVQPVDEAQTRTAMQARITFGKGFGAKAGLNFGDCFSYALAVALKAPLLYIGNDFTHTDLTPALQPV